MKPLFMPKVAVVPLLGGGETAGGPSRTVTVRFKNTRMDSFECLMAIYILSLTFILIHARPEPALPSAPKRAPRQMPPLQISIEESARIPPHILFMRRFSDIKRSIRSEDCAQVRIDVGAVLAFGWC